MLSIFFSVSCIKVVAGMIGEEWEGGVLPCKWKASLLFFSSPWKLDLGRTGEVKELGVIEKWNVFSFLFRRMCLFQKENITRTHLCQRNPLQERPQHRKPTKISVLFHCWFQKISTYFLIITVYMYNNKSAAYMENLVNLWQMHVSVTWPLLHAQIRKTENMMEKSRFI